LQTQVARNAKTDAAALQKKTGFRHRGNGPSSSPTSRSPKAATVEVQARLEKAHAANTTFQTQAEENKVASLKHQGEVEVAHAQTAVMLEQLNKAKSDLATSRPQLTETQDKLDKAEQEIARLQKPPAKK